MKNNFKIGQKIKQFRLRKKLSQLELELKINASTGTISRLENGVVNPTKETLLSIIDVLDLSAREAADLFSINVNDNLANLIRVSKELNSDDIDEILHKAVNLVVNELGLLGAFIGLVNGNTIYAKTFTTSWYTQLVERLIKSPFSTYSLSLSNSNQKNLMIRTVKDQKNYYSTLLADHVSPPLNKKVAALIQKVVGQKSGISLPIVSKGQTIGLIYFSKNYVDDFTSDLNVLTAFCENIAVVVENAQRYRKMKEELNKLENSDYK